MAYADPLDPTTPGDLSIAGQGDDRIRELKRALIARLLTLVTDVNADPLVLKNLLIATAMLQDKAVTGAKIADKGVDTGQIADGAVETLQLADDAVTVDKIIDGAVETPQLKDFNVTAVKIADDAVVTRTILDANVTEPKLADDAVSTRTIVDGAVTAAKLDAGVINTNSIIMLQASRVLSQAEAEIAGDSFEEYDIPLVGAKVGYPVIVERTSPEPYPTTGALPGSGGWMALSQMPAQAFCIAVDKIRVHVSNRTGGLTGPVGGCTMKVTQFQFADGH